MLCFPGPFKNVHKICLIYRKHGDYTYLAVNVCEHKSLRMFAISCLVSLPIYTIQMYTVQISRFCLYLFLWSSVNFSTWMLPSKDLFGPPTTRLIYHFVLVICWQVSFLLKPKYKAGSVRVQDKLIYFPRSLAHFPIYSYTD